MSEIAVAKQQLVDHYATYSIDVLGFIPERVVPPVAIINAGSTYLRPDTLGKGWVMNLELTLVAAQAINEEATAALDLFIENTLNHCPDFAVILDVTKPFILQANSAEYLATTINIDVFITI
jgi:hypothetical protein